MIRAVTNGYAAARARLLAVLALAVLALAGGLGLPAFARPAAAQVQGATISAIVDNASAYVGQTVTVTGEVEQVLGPRSFLIEDDDFLSDDTLPVVSASAFLSRAGQQIDAERLLNSDEMVTVTGTVHIFNLAAFEERLGVDLDDEAFDAWAGKPAIIATAIRRAPCD